MATHYWLGTAPTVAQADTIQITADDAATTYIITIGAITVSVLGTGTGVNDTAAALQVALAAATHIYFTSITWTVATDTVTGTAGTAGVPFTATSSATGGAGTIGAVTNATASEGPGDWSTAENWSGATVPVGGDTVVITDNGNSIAYGFAQSGITLTQLRIEKGFTGRIGLNYQVFATSTNGETVDTTAPEYRATYLAISATDMDLGENFGTGTPNGSGRIMVDLGTNASTTEIHGTANSSTDVGRPAVRLLASHVNTEIYVREALGGVGVAADEPGETSTVSKVSISATGTGTSVEIGIGTTITTFEQNGGTSTLQAAATVTTVLVNGGALTTEGDYTVTTMEINDGQVNCNHEKAGNAITTLNLNNGTMDGTGSNIARTWATVNLVGGSITLDPDVVTITTLNDPVASGAYTISVT